MPLIAHGRCNRSHPQKVRLYSNAGCHTFLLLSHIKKRSTRQRVTADLAHSRLNNVLREVLGGMNLAEISKRGEVVFVLPAAMIQ